MHCQHLPPATGTISSPSTTTTSERSTGSSTPLRAGLGKCLTIGITGDPPGTWRGARFTTDLAVIMTFPGDKPKDYRDLLPCKTRLVTASAPDEVLSARMKRHAASGSSDHRWWRA